MLVLLREHSNPKLTLLRYAENMVYFMIVKLLTTAAITITAPITNVIVSIKTISFLLVGRREV